MIFPLRLLATAFAPIGARDADGAIGRREDGADAAQDAARLRSMDAARLPTLALLACRLRTVRRVAQERTANCRLRSMYAAHRTRHTLETHRRAHRGARRRRSDQPTGRRRGRATGQRRRQSGEAKPTGRRLAPVVRSGTARSCDTACGEIGARLRTVRHVAQERTAQAERLPRRKQGIILYPIQQTGTLEVLHFNRKTTLPKTRTRYKRLYKASLK